ncbi:ThiS family protein [Desulfosporosinus orientis DSM 765]|uniref:ThiS family protein n=1 Tax=Desulfosporosinus orientis (strain ATCC 19365 / DSM 765 / NCIMB 8382 / VKM B-1628 / Singapore I) TaxID=768706 RepID=G7WIE5_DESOD|nr:MoaD/ThiS family protein [Desulfosporosinus orientis]AET68593.1 ThiS family protein [Desulfosporosinus orientis DSM 765]
MLLNIKLFGGLVCGNPDLPFFGLNRLQMEMGERASLTEVLESLNLAADANLVLMVNGHAQSLDYILHHDSVISVFPPMIP